MEKSRDSASNAAMSAAEHIRRAKEILRSPSIRHPFAMASIHLNRAVGDVGEDGSRKNIRIRVAKLCEGLEHYNHRSGPAMLAGLNYSGAAALAETLDEKQELYLNAARNFDHAMRTSQSRQLRAAEESSRAYESARAISTDQSEIERLSHVIELRKGMISVLRVIDELETGGYWPTDMKNFISDTAGRLSAESPCSVTRLADALNIPEVSAEKLANLSEVTLSDMRGRWTRKLTPERAVVLKKLRALVRKGLPQPQIGAEIGKERRTLHMFLRYNSMLEEWRVKNALYKDRLKRKKAAEERRERLEKRRPFRIVPTDGWAERRAKKYMLQNRTSLAPAEMYKRLLTIFREYKSAKDSGSSRSLEQLGAPLGLFPGTVSGILKKAKLPFLTPLRWNAKLKNAL